MAYNAQNGGVYILINGDASPLQRTLENLKKNVSSTAKQIEAEMQGVFGRADISRVANTAISAFARLRTSIRAAGTDIQGHTREWAAYGRQIGLADEQAQKLAETINRSLHEKNIRQVESSLRTLQRQTGMATSEVIRLAREMGAVEVAGRKAFAELGIRSGAQIRSEIKSIVSAYAELRKSGTATAQDLARAQTAMRQRVAELRTELAGVQPVANQTYESVKRIGLAAVSIAAVTASVKSLIDTMVEVDSLKVSYASIFGGDEGGKEQLDYIYKISQKLGLEFNSAAKSVKGFFAASKGTSLEKDMNRIFEGVSEATVALHLSADDIQGVFLALAQMASKGKISMEEMRQQLGERLPGAFKIAAEAMGMTSEQLDEAISKGRIFAEDLLPKMADAFHKKWGAAAIEASKSIQSELNRISADFTLLKTSILDSDTVATVLNKISSAIKTLRDGAESGWLDRLVKGFTALTATLVGVNTLLNTTKASIAASISFLGGPYVIGIGLAAGAIAALTSTTKDSSDINRIYKDTITDTDRVMQEYGDSIKKVADNMNQVKLDKLSAEIKKTESDVETMAKKATLYGERIKRQIQGIGDPANARGLVEINNIWNQYLEGLKNGHPEHAKTWESLKKLENTYPSLVRELLETVRANDKARTHLSDLQLEFNSTTNSINDATFALNEFRKACNSDIYIDLSSLDNALRKSEERIKEKQLEMQGLSRNAVIATALPNATAQEVGTLSKTYSKAIKDGASGAEALATGIRSIGRTVDELDIGEIERLGTALSQDFKESVVNRQHENYRNNLKKTASVHKSSSAKAANAQGTYNTTLETTQEHIEALQEQLKLDKTQTVAQKKIALENKYATAIAKTTEQIQKQIRSGSISAEQGKKLIALKKEENTLELRLKIREMEDKAIQENLSHLQEELEFYNELAEMSGNFTTSMELQNKIIDIQAQKYRDLGKIPEEMIQKWTEWKKLQASTDPFDGAYRGLLKFQAEFGNSAKQWEDLTYNFAKNFESASHQMFDDFLETGKLSFDSIGKLFKQLLKDMAYYALIQPIVLSTVGGFAGTSGSINGAVNGTSTGNNLANAVSGMAQGAVISKAGGGLMSAAGNFLNSSAASLFPGTFADSTMAATANTVANASFVAGGGSATLPTQTATGMLGSGWTMGAGLLGGAIGNYLLVPALGIKSGTGTSIGGMVGGAAGSIGGGLLGATALGASVGGPIGAGIGALIGTVAGAFGGSLFGGEELEPGYYINAWTDLTSKKGLSGYKSGTATQNHSWDGFPSGTASRMRDEVARPIMDQLRTTTSEIKGQLKTVGGDALGKSFFDAVRKYQRSPSKNTGKYGEDLSQFFQIHGEWGDTTSPDIETWTKNLTKQYQEVIVKSIANMDMTPITKAADGFVANTEEEIAVALVKAGQLIAVGDTIDDEELRESFQTGISKSLISALRKIDTSKLGLKIDKSSLEGWVVAAQAMQNGRKLIQLLMP